MNGQGYCHNQINLLQSYEHIILLFTNLLLIKFNHNLLILILIIFINFMKVIN